MKVMFSITALALSVLGLLTLWSYPTRESKVPVLYWITDPNPMRTLQVDRFHQWLIEEGHTTHDGQPRMLLKLDTGNSDKSKMIIQGVSGMGGDIMDLGSGGSVRYFKSMGLITDLTEVAQEKGFSVKETYPSLKSDLSIYENGEHRQYAFPCNAYTSLYWINRDVFKKYGIQEPNDDWTWEDFERLGLELKAAAQGETVYISQRPNVIDVARSYGLGLFNETLTRCAYNQAIFIDALLMLERWTDELGIVPTKADLESFDVQSGYGGASLQLFKEGVFGAFVIGRYGLIGFREGASMNLRVVYPPHGTFKCSSMGTRCAAIYKGSQHPEEAALFLEYLASEPYNDTIIEGADALPPNPAFLHKRSYTHPPLYSNEWGCHEVFTRAMKDIAVPKENSPYINSSVVERIFYKWVEKFEAKITSAEETALGIEIEIHAEMERFLEEFPNRRKEYQQALEQQKQINALKASGEMVPASLILNPFHLSLARRQGWLKEKS